MYSHCMHTASMQSASTVKRHRYRQVSLRAFSFVLGISYSCMMRMKQVYGKHINSLNICGIQGLEPFTSAKCTKSEKDISDFFALGNGAKELKELLAKMFTDLYSQTMMMLRSCEIDYENPPDISKSVVAVNGVPLGTQDNLSASLEAKVRVRVTMWVRSLLGHWEKNDYR